MLLDPTNPITLTIIASLTLTGGIFGLYVYAMLSLRANFQFKPWRSVAFASLAVLDMMFLVVYGLGSLTVGNGEPIVTPALSIGFLLYVVPLSHLLHAVVWYRSTKDDSVVL